MLKELKKNDPNQSDWSASFRCVMVLVRGSKRLAKFEGSVHGMISNVERGDKGFGYDSIFIPEGFQNSFAELPLEIKNSMSHRGRALSDLKSWLSSGALND